jgi:hypothetical protein
VAMDDHGAQAARVEESDNDGDEHEERVRRWRNGTRPRKVRGVALGLGWAGRRKERRGRPPGKNEAGEKRE